MPGRPLLYYITDRTQFTGNEAERRQKLLAKISEAAACSVDFIQLREKDLSTRELEVLAKQALEAIRTGDAGNEKPATCLLINSRSDIALAAGADGVHLRSHDISIRDVRALYESCKIISGKTQVQSDHAVPQEPRALAPEGRLSTATSESGHSNWLVAVSCHKDEEVRAAALDGADFVVFAPVFEKTESNPAGLDALRRACQRNIPVLALGGVTLDNAQFCLDAGAAGIAGIRLFQGNDISRVVQRIRGRGKS